MRRNESLRRKHRAIIAQDEPPCHVCHEPIDYTAPYPHPLSFTIDHIAPLARVGMEGDVLDNIAAAHAKCNRDKSDKVAAGVNFVTDRSW